MRITYVCFTCHQGTWTDGERPRCPRCRQPMRRRGLTVVVPVSELPCTINVAPMLMDLTRAIAEGRA